MFFVGRLSRGRFGRRAAAAVLRVPSQRDLTADAPQLIDQQLSLAVVVIQRKPNQGHRRAVLLAPAQ